MGFCLGGPGQVSAQIGGLALESAQVVPGWNAVSSELVSVRGRRIVGEHEE